MPIPSERAHEAMQVVSQQGDCSRSRANPPIPAAAPADPIRSPGGTASMWRPPTAVARAGRPAASAPIRLSPLIRDLRSARCLVSPSTPAAVTRKEDFTGTATYGPLRERWGIRPNWWRLRQPVGWRDDLIWSGKVGSQRGQPYIESCSSPLSLVRESDREPFAFGGAGHVVVGGRGSGEGAAAALPRPEVPAEVLPAEVLPINGGEVFREGTVHQMLFNAMERNPTAGDAASPGAAAALCVASTSPTLKASSKCIHLNR